MVAWHQPSSCRSHTGGFDDKPGLLGRIAVFSARHRKLVMVVWAIVALGAAPLAITVIFGDKHILDAATGMWTHVKNPAAPSALTYAWIGPFLGAAARPFGGWISDKLGGSVVTQVVSAVMAVASVATGYVMFLAYHSETPEQYFLIFMLLFSLLFLASGVGNGSTFRSVGHIFNREQAGPVLGWTSAVAAYGSFVAPTMIGGQIHAGTPENAMYGFALFYAICLVINWWFYLRKNAYVRNP